MPLTPPFVPINSEPRANITGTTSECPLHLENERNPREVNSFCELCNAKTVSGLKRSTCKPRTILLHPVPELASGLPGSAIVLDHSFQQSRYFLCGLIWGSQLLESKVRSLELFLENEVASCPRAVSTDYSCSLVGCDCQVHIKQS